MVLSEDQFLCAALFDEIKKLGIVDKPRSRDYRDFSVWKFKLVLSLDEELSKFGKWDEVNSKLDECLDIKPINIFIDFNRNLGFANVVGLPV